MGRILKSLDAIRILIMLNALDKDAVDSGESGSVRLRPNTVLLADMARSLASSTTPDDEIIRDLRQAARGKRYMSDARRLLRMGGGNEESRVIDRADRLLLSAFTRQPLLPVSPERTVLFSRIDAIMNVRVEDAFPELHRLEPRLGSLKDDLGSMSPDDVDRLPEVDRNALWNKLLSALRPLLGPDAEAGITDPLLRSRSAFNVARLYLALQMGLLREVEYEDDGDFPRTN